MANNDTFIQLLHREVKPALGCTEPIAVALAVAAAAEHFTKSCRPALIDVAVSPNILKNGMGVGIPGTGMVGLDIATALGVTCGHSKYGLEVLKDINAEALAKAKELLGIVKVHVADTTEKLYVKAVIEGEDHSASAVISGSHDNIVEITEDGKVMFSAEKKQASDNQEDKKEPAKDISQTITVNEIFEFATTAPLEILSFIEDSITLNEALADEGLAHDYGLKVGKTLLNKKYNGIMGDGQLLYCMSRTAAASDARMAGSTLPAMSNSGSGNQGITVTMPVISMAKQLGSSHEQLIRALTLSHLIAIHIKGYLGKLSALCGCVIASTGSSCGIVYLMGGGYDAVCAAIKNMTGNITGMVCDGAKVGCAMKVASGVASSVQSAILALEGIQISSNEGIIEEDIEKTISNLGRIGSQGMTQTDAMILDIMVCK